ncbi:MAG TPA: RICIN domain-containing protein [bacterium]
MELQLSSPVILWYLGRVNFLMCAQAQSVGQGAFITLQPIDYTGNTLQQQFQFGNDGRIYAAGSSAKFCLTYQGSAQNGSQLVLEPADDSNQTQMWVWNKLFLENVGASNNQNQIIYVMDDWEQNVSSGNKIQIWQSNGGLAQFWAPVLVQAFTINLVSQARAR